MKSDKMAIMERVHSINSGRIIWCCEDIGIVPGDLASELGIAPSSIERMMSGEDGVTFKQLRKISDYFSRGVLFFLEEGPVDETQVHTPQFRTLANQKPELSSKLKALIERVEKQRDVFLSLLEDLDDAGRSSFSPPNLSQKNSHESARIVRKWLGLGSNNDFSSFRKAVEAKGILVFRSNGYDGKWQIAKGNPILGFTLYNQNYPVIVIKKQSAESRQSFTLIHELGHLLLHKTSSIDDELDLYSSKKVEHEANAFAGSLLVPDTFLATIQDIDRPDEISQYDTWLHQQRKSWGVSGEVILRRLLDTGRLRQNQYKDYRKWQEQLIITPKTRGSREYRYREPKHIFGDKFVRTVLDALYARHITLSKASSYLDSLKIKDLHKLEHHYAGL